MKAAFAIFALTFAFHLPAARGAASPPKSEGLELAEEILLEDDVDAPKEEKREQEKKSLERTDESPVPAVAVSIATLAEDAPAPGSLAYEMSTVDLLADAPAPETAPAHEDVAQR